MCLNTTRRHLIMNERFLRYLLLLSGCMLTALLTGCASTMTDTLPSSSDMPPAINANGIMVGTASRLTLYTYDADASNHSNCLDQCLSEWLPLYASDYDESRGDFSVFMRPDGRRQWALVGKPLYFWAGEVRPGEGAGEKADPRWKVFRVADYRQ